MLITLTILDGGTIFCFVFYGISHTRWLGSSIKQKFSVFLFMAPQSGRHFFEALFSILLYFHTSAAHLNFIFLVVSSFWHNFLELYKNWKLFYFLIKVLNPQTVNCCHVQYIWACCCKYVGCIQLCVQYFMYFLRWIKFASCVHIDRYFTEYYVNVWKPLILAFAVSSEMKRMIVCYHSQVIDTWVSRSFTVSLRSGM